ncbi:MAG: DUF4397 domain-containing protein [Anaerolineae bacterium]|nr:DUF4397 domain-containing protein [Anaerolineae bacterium]MDW8173208.1 DUF4397 domain-containing protein [Anaerolineae bacterium]
MAMRKFGAFIGLIALLVLSACQAQPSLPTIVPTVAPPSVTPTAEASATPTLTRTPRPTPTPAPTLPQAVAPSPDLQAYLRFVHAAPGSGPVDVYIDNLPIATFVAYSQFNTNLPMSQGDYTLAIVPQGAADLSQPILRQALSVRGRQQITLVYHGQANDPRLLVHVEDTAPSQPNQARLTLINAVSGSLSVSLFNQDIPIIQAVASGTASPAVNQSIGEGVFSVRDGELPLLSERLNVRSLKAYTFVVFGLPNAAENLRLITLQADLAGIASVRAINMGLNDVGLDVYWGEQFLGDISYRSLTPRLTVPAFSQALRLYPRGADRRQTQPIFEEIIGISPGDVVTFVIIGEPNLLRVVPFREDLSPIVGDFARVTFMNTLPTVPRVQRQSNVQETIELRYGEISRAELIPAGDLPMSWIRLENGRPTETLEFVRGLNLEAGKSYLYLFAARNLDEPILIETTVGVLQPTPDPSSVATPVLAPQARFVNGIEGLTVEFRLNDVPVANLASFQGSSPLLIGAGQNVITVHNIQTQLPIARLIYAVGPGEKFSFYVYATSFSTFDLLAIRDNEDELADDAPIVRLVNLSSTSVSYSLGYANPSAFTLVQEVSTPAPINTGNGQQEGFEGPVESSGTAARGVTIPGGLRTWAEPQDSGRGSAYAEAQTGTFDLYVVNPQTRSVEGLLEDVALSPNQRYEVLAILRPEAPLPRVVLLSAPR